MVRRAKASQIEPSPPSVSPQQGKGLLEQQIQKGDRILAQRPVEENEYHSWELITRNVLEKAFGIGSPNVSDVIETGALAYFGGDTDWDKHYAGKLTRQLTKLRGLVELLTTETQLQRVGAVQPDPPAQSHRIFLVHGHDDQAVQMISRFLERLGQEVIILREQPNQGQTIIEKFEDCADVGFAIVLLTPDDRGGTKNTAFEQQKPRARQNVVFELGYFIGRLTRNRVCALHRGGVEIPSDYQGVVYHELDSGGGWQLALAKELKAAGLPIDMNKAL